MRNLYIGFELLHLNVEKPINVRAQFLWDNWMVNKKVMLAIATLAIKMVTFSKYQNGNGYVCWSA